MGSCVYHVAHQSMRQAFQADRARTSRCRTSRRRSTTRGSWRWSACSTRRSKLQAEGVVAVRLEENSHGWGSHVIEFFAVGTAITSAAGAGSGIEKPTLTLPVDG